jgi:Putative zinc-finger
MNCNEVEQREILESYLLDRLAEPEREEFEKHYFECASCFSQLQTRLAVQAELQHQPAMPARARGASFRLGWAWAPAFVTVALLLAVGIWWYSAQRQHPQQVSVSPPKRESRGIGAYRAASANSTVPGGVGPRGTASIL